MKFNKASDPKGYIDINLGDWVKGKSITGYNVSGYITKIYEGEVMYGIEPVITIISDKVEIDCHVYEINLDIKKIRELKLKTILNE